MTSDDRTIILNLAQQVGHLTGQVADLRGDIGEVRDGVSDVADQVRALQLAAQRAAGAADATRQLAEQAGATAARSEQRRERWIQRAATLISLIVATYAAAIKGG